MRFIDTGLSGAFIVDVEPVVDERGLFARSWCTREFEEHGLNPRLVQCSVCLNHRKGTLRGMHYQTAPHQEAKLVRCTRGVLYDVIVALRPESRTYLKHFGAELTATNHRALYVPEGFAHGYLTLADESEVFYQMSEFYAPAAARGVRWNDPAIGIVWPGPVVVISERDSNFPDYEAAVKEPTP
jgi:dTDP-4-dehydrorhamnose 3,5-epimerase